MLKKGDFSALSEGDMVPWLLFDSSDSEYLEIKDSMLPGLQELITIK